LKTLGAPKLQITRKGEIFTRQRIYAKKGEKTRFLISYNTTILLYYLKYKIVKERTKQTQA
jgi:hypothetical protein